MLLVALLLVLLSGCQSEKEDVFQESVRQKPFSGQKVTFLVSEPHAKAANAAAQWYYQERGGIVEIQVVRHDQLLDSILTDQQEAAKLDLFMAWYVDLGKLVDSQALTDLTDWINAHQKQLKPGDYLPSIYDTYTLYQGRRWSLPYDGDTHLLFYRPSVLAKYGLTPPTTWKDYSIAIKTITEASNGEMYGSAIMAFPSPMLIVSSFMNRLGGYGGNLFDENHSPRLNSPAAKQALDDLLQQAEYALPHPLKTDFAVSRDAFLTGQVAMVEQWSDIGIMAEDPSQSLIKGDWGVTQIPKGNTRYSRHSPALNAGFFIGLSSKAPNKNAALDFLLFVSRPDVTLQLNLINGGIDPTRRSVLSSPAFVEFAPAISKAEKGSLQRATPWPTGPDAPRLMQTLSSNLAAALSGDKSSEQALNDTQRTWQRILNEPR